MRRRWATPVSGIPWHPVAFGVAYVSLYWVEAAVSPLAAIRALLIVVAAIGLLQVGLTLALRDAGRGALVTSVIVLAAISKVVIRTVATAPQALGAPLAALWLGAIVLAILLVIRIARRAARSVVAWHGESDLEHLLRRARGSGNRQCGFERPRRDGHDRSRPGIDMDADLWITGSTVGSAAAGHLTFTSSCWTGIQAAARSIVCSASTTRRSLMRSSSAVSMWHKTAGRTTCGRTSR